MNNEDYTTQYNSEPEDLTDANWDPRDESLANSDSSVDSDIENVEIMSLKKTVPTHKTNNDQKIFQDKAGRVKNNEEGNDENAKNKKKKKCDEGKWIRNVRKLNRNTGVAHLNSRKNPVAERKMLEPCKESCIFKCGMKINEAERLNIFNRFWKLGDLQNQRSFILKCLSAIPHTITSSSSVQRKPNQAFHFEVNDIKVRVCKVFFTHTLGISDRVVRTVINKTNDGFLEAEKRGKHGKQKKIDESIKEGIIKHINSIPRIESHYLRAQTTREFIDGGKTLSDIHRDYQETCKSEGRQFGNYTMFSRIFRGNFNISFFTPKKDQCSSCEQYKNSDEKGKKALQEKYEMHLKEKEKSRLEKENDKQLAKSNKCVTACFDLQAVLQTPCGEINSFYYKSKLSTYNFTIFNLGSLEGHCYIWHEGEGNRGANEIGTCLYNFLKLCAQNIPVVLYSDNCCGQNKNKYIASMLLYAVTQLNIPSISLKFLVVGHTQNEGDNMHSLIEKQKKRTLKSGPVYTPAQWVPIIANAKKTGTPYKITEMDFNEFYNLKSLQESMGNNFTVNESGEKVLWHDIAVLKFLKEDNFTIYYKNSYDDADFKKIIIRKKIRESSHNPTLKPAYTQPIKISQTKLDALSELCNKDLIKNKYHAFYKSLGCNIPTLPTQEKRTCQEDASKLRKKKKN